MDKVLMKTSYMGSSPFLPEMRPNGPINNYDYMMELYNDAGIRSTKEINMTDSKDDSTETSSDESADRLVIADCDESEKEQSSEDSNSITEERNSVVEDSISVTGDSNSTDSDYIYTLDGSGAVETCTKTGEEISQDTPTDFSKPKQKDVKSNDDTGYVYIMETENAGAESKKVLSVYEKHIEPSCTHPTNGEPLGKKGKVNGLNNTTQQDHTETPMDFSLKSSEVIDMTKSSNAISEQDSKNSPKSSVLNGFSMQPGAVKLTGASKRKRKFSLENTITQLLKTKYTRHEDSGDDSNSNHSQTEGAIQNETVFNEVNVVDLSVQAKTAEKVDNKKKECSQNGQSNQAVENWSFSRKPNRRKSSVVSRCVNNVESELERQNTQSQNTQNLTHSPKMNSHDQPLDFSISKTPETKPVVPQENAIRNENPEVIDLSVKNTNNKPIINGIKQAKKDAPSLSDSINASLNLSESMNTSSLNPSKLMNTSSLNQSEFMNTSSLNPSELMDLMKKYSSQYINHNMMNQKMMNQNMMNQNMMASMLQLQLWMQAAAMNNAVGGKKGKTDKALKNDVNKNVVMRDLLTTPAFPDIAGANVSMLMANQMAASPITDGAATYLNKIKTKAAKVLEKDLQIGSNKRSDNYDDIEMQKYTGPGITNWTVRPDEEAMGKIFLTKFREEKEGEPVKFFVRDNEQVQAILSLLNDLGTLTSEQIPVGLEQMRYTCSICEQRFFHVEHLNKHIKKRHILKKFLCTVCDRSFHDAGNFRQHMRVHDANDVPYECPECQRKFRHKCTLKVHMRIHTGEKPFKCDICHAAFKISSGLQTHMRKHTGETPYACEYCNMRFKCQSNLKQHLFQHTQARPFPCDICGKNYSRKSIRDSHRQTHFKGDVYKGNMETLSLSAGDSLMETSMEI